MLDDNNVNIGSSLINVSIWLGILITGEAMNVQGKGIYGKWLLFNFTMKKFLL